MESVKSIVKDVVYGKSKIHTNMEFTFSNNNLNENFTMIVYKFPKRYYTCIDYFLNSLK